MRFIIEIFVQLLAMCSTQSGDAFGNATVMPQILGADLRNTMDSVVPLFEFQREAVFVLPSRIMQEANGTVTWEFSNFTRVSTLRKLKNVMSQEEVAQMLKLLPQQFSTLADSVDLLPSHEYYIENHIFDPRTIRLPADTSPLVNLTRRIIENRLLPYMRERYSCPKCRVCASLVRRYRSGDRMSHPAHYDNQAFITAVVSLTSYGEHFTGGLYTRTLPGTERFISTQAGEAIVHQHDLEHGVRVAEGVRYSWILWLQDSSTCQDKPNPDWFLHDAYKGDPVALFNMGTQRRDSEALVDQAANQAFRFFQIAAKKEYPRAQFKLAQSYYSGRGVEQNYSLARYWFEKAADQNMSIAAYNLAKMISKGEGGAPDEAAAEKRYRQILGDAFEPQVAAFNNLAVLLYRGAPGIHRNLEEAKQLWERAAQEGLAVGALNLAEVYKNDNNTKASKHWHARYAELKAQINQGLS